MTPSAAFPLCLAAAALALQPATVHAADEDTQLWLNAAASMPVGDETTLAFDLSERLREGEDQQLARFSLDTALARGLTIGAGYAFVASGPSDEHRPHQQLVLRIDNTQVRVRLEERFFERADQPAIRLRGRLQQTVPLSDSTRLIGSAEWLYTLQQRSDDLPATTDSLRGIVAIQHRLTGRIDVSAGYLALYAPRRGERDRLSHVPQLGLSLRL